MTAAPGQAGDVPDAYARYLFATFPADLGDFAQHEAAMRWKHLTGEREREFWRSLAAAPELELRAENEHLRAWLLGIMRGGDAEIEAARMQADEWITEEGL